MNTEDFTEFEERYYLSPTTERDEQEAFITNLRGTMSNNLNQINQGTYNLGSPLPSNLGGLSGAEETFEARYQRPQVESTATQLRSAAQASALNTALSNLQNAYKKRYNDAMLKYQRRAASSSGNPNGSGGEDGLPITTNGGSALGNTGVKLNQAAQEAFDYMKGTQMNQAMTNVATLRQQNQFPTSNSEVFMYKINGQPYYATLYRDTLGRIQGISSNNANYDATGAKEFLRSLESQNNLFDNNGKALTAMALGGI